MGTIFSPNAEVQEGEGNINGGVISRKFLGNKGEVHKIEFLPGTEEPTVSVKPNKPVQRPNDNESTLPVTGLSNYLLGSMGIGFASLGYSLRRGKKDK